MKKILISIIVPIFNSQQYLKQCIDSILVQTYTNIEIILVDDGSTDMSSQICDAYTVKDNRVKVIHKKNGGNTSARKSGLNLVSGDYIAFVDSDDWIDDRMYEEMVNIIMQSKANIVASGCYEEYLDKTVQDINLIEPGNYRDSKLEMDFYPVMLYSGIYYRFGILPYLCNKLFEKNIIINSMLELDERIHNGEDAVCLFPCMLKAKCISVTEKCWYHYRIREDSICRTVDERFFENMGLVYNKLRDAFIISPYAKVLMKQLKYYMMRLTFVGTEMLFGLRYNPPSLFPYEIIEKGSNIILYGAGDIGQSFYKQLENTKYCNVVLWVDRDFNRYENFNLPVASLDRIGNMEYDYIVIAICDEPIAQQVKDNLIHIGLEESKIIWKKPFVIDAADSFVEMDN